MERLGFELNLKVQKGMVEVLKEQDFVSVSEGMNLMGWRVIKEDIRFYIVFVFLGFCFYLKYIVDV